MPNVTDISAIFNIPVLMFPIPKFIKSVTVNSLNNLSNKFPIPPPIIQEHVIIR